MVCRGGLSARPIIAVPFDISDNVMFVGTAFMPSVITFIGLGTDGINAVPTINGKGNCYNANDHRLVTVGAGFQPTPTDGARISRFAAFSDAINCVPTIMDMKMINGW